MRSRSLPAPTGITRPLLTAAVAGLATWIGAAPLQAQWWEQPQRREIRRPPAVPTAVRKETKVDETTLKRQVAQPLMAIVSISDQRITVYDANGRILRAPVSSGTTGYESPVGIFKILQKNRDHVSNIYEGAAMPFMQRITWSGIALHAGALPGYPASHGCVRLPYKFAENLFELTEKGMRVVVVRNDMSPVDISHPALFSPPISRPLVASAPLPAVGPDQPMRLGASDVSTPDADALTYFDKLKAIADTKAAEAEAANRTADAARLRANRLNAEAARDAKFLRGAEYVKTNLEAQLRYAETLRAAANNPAAIARADQAVVGARKRLDDANARLAAILAQPKVEAAEAAKKEAAALDEARKRAVEEAKAAQRKLTPISVLISRKTQRLYVRQLNEPVLETAVVIRDADKPIGTTLFTALGYNKDGSGVRWNAVAMYAKGMAPDPAKPLVRRAVIKTPEPTPTSADDAKAVLDRIEIPEEARRLISEVVAPGSSLIVSDEPASTETGGGTDFIMVMPGEPQGGLKIRPKAPPRSIYRYDDDDDDRPRRRRARYYSSDW